VRTSDVKPGQMRKWSHVLIIPKSEDVYFICKHIVFGRYNDGKCRIDYAAKEVIEE
jgi:hypothetical protein